MSDASVQTDVIIASPAEMGQLLTELRDIHLPEPISWWPLAPGWWLLAAIAFFVGVALIRRVRNARSSTAPPGLVRQLQSLLNDSYRQWQKTGHTGHYLQATNAALRRFALTTQTTDQVAGLTGPAWRRQIASLSTHPLDNDHLEAITESAYQAKPNIDIERLHHDLAQWIENHREPVNA